MSEGEEGVAKGDSIMASFSVDFTERRSDSILVSCLSRERERESGGENES